MRTQETINQEYSEVCVKIGDLESKIRHWSRIARDLYEQAAMLIVQKPDQPEDKPEEIKPAVEPEVLPAESA